MSGGSGLKLPILSAIYLTISLLKDFPWYLVILGTAGFFFVDRYFQIYLSFEGGSVEAEKNLKNRKPDLRQAA